MLARVLMAIAVLTPGGAALGQTPSLDDTDAAIARGDALMVAFRTADAIAAYDAALIGDERDAPELLMRASRARMNLAVETVATENDERLYRDAELLARRAARAAPGSARAHATLAAAVGRLALFEGGRRKVALAREVYDEASVAIELDPFDFAAFAVLGVWHREIATLNPFLRLVARAFLGGLQPASLERSAANLERAVRLAPDFVAPRMALAVTHVALERDEAARDQLEAALALAPRETLDRALQERAGRLLATLDGD